MQYVVITDNVFSFVRHYKNHAPYLVALNFGKETSANDYSHFLDSYHSEGTAEVVSSNSSIQLGAKVLLKKLQLASGEGLVLRVD